MLTMWFADNNDKEIISFIRNYKKEERKNIIYSQISRRYKMFTISKQMFMKKLLCIVFFYIFLILANLETLFEANMFFNNY